MMSWGEYLWVAACIREHAKAKIVARTRAQKMINLLQRLGLPTSYPYSIHHFGPYSEDLQSDLRLLEDYGVLKEEEGARDGVPFFALAIEATATLPDLTPDIKSKIDLLARHRTVDLELAATYLAFLDAEKNTDAAMRRLIAKKGQKCSASNLESMHRLINELGLA